MSPKLFALLVEKMEEFIDSNERNANPSFFVGEKTALFLARAAEAVYDGMSDADELKDKN